MAIQVWRKIGACVVAMTALSATSGHAAAPSDWWVYVRNDQADNVRTLLAQGADPNQRSSNDQPAIMQAIAENAWRVFDVLAAHPRIDLNVQNPAGETPLMYLALVGATERAKTLIALGAQVNRLGWTPLHYAASRGQVDTARLLVTQGAMPNAPAPEGVTPLMMGAYSGRPDMVQLLLNQGADPTARDSRGQDAADWARQGQWRALSDELRRVITVTLNQREARRGNTAGPDTAPTPEKSVTHPETSSDPALLQGVSGVRLGNY